MQKARKAFASIFMLGFACIVSSAVLVWLGARPELNNVTIQNLTHYPYFS
jgi:hypothetical protein